MYETSEVGTGMSLSALVSEQPTTTTIVNRRQPANSDHRQRRTYLMTALSKVQGWCLLVMTSWEEDLPHIHSNTVALVISHAFVARVSVHVTYMVLVPYYC